SAKAYPDAAFYLFHTRAWELLAGVLLAYYRHKNNEKSPALPMQRWLAPLGLLFILGPMLMLNDEILHPSFITLFPVLGTVMVIAYAPQSMLALRLLSAKICVGIGLISYSLYLWHQPLLAFTRI